MQPLNLILVDNLELNCSQNVKNENVYNFRSLYCFVFYYIYIL